MTKLRKGLIVAAAAVVIGGSGLAVTRAASAATNDNSANKTSLIDKLATKFGLNKDDVQKVFDENHAERKVEHQAKQSERLQKLVDAGTITVDQKAKIEAKITELQTKRDAEKSTFKDLTSDERKARMNANKAEIDQWAKDNGIDLTKLQGILTGHTRSSWPRHSR